MVPNRDQVTMKTPFMESYSLRVIQKCHKRGVHAMGGMAAQIPIKNDVVGNEIAFKKVIADKLQEVKNGHDGTWVAHPGLVNTAMGVFNENMVTKNQIHVKRADINISSKDLVEMPVGTITEEGIRKNINVGILYIESWLRGNGAAALYNLMEDAATAEISRTQIWLWLQNEIKLKDGITFNTKNYEKIKHQEIEKIKDYVGEDKFNIGKFEKAIQLFDEFVLAKDFQEFLTLEAYKYI
jgi:malate synthase